MTTPLWCLLFFAVWTVSVAFVGVAGARTLEVFAGRSRAHTFPGDVPHGPERYRRTMRAHANCVENLPVFAAVVVVAHLAGIASPSIDLAAQVVVVGRVAQTIIHIAAHTHTSVVLRAIAYGVQVLAFLAIAVEIVRA